MGATPPASPALLLGEAPPLLRVASNLNPHFAFGALGGRYVLLCVIADRLAPAARGALAALAGKRPDAADRVCAVFLADETDAGAQSEAGSAQIIFTDPAAARTMRLVGEGAPAEGRWVLLDPTLRVLALWPLDQCAEALAMFERLPPPSAHAGVPLHAPVLIVPRVFEPAFCKTLIDYYETTGGVLSGVTRQKPDGRTFLERDDNFKRRSDCLIEEESLRQGAMQRIALRLLPEIEKAFMWRATRLERYLVARYDAESGGFFRPHRDNTTKGTAHRRFAVTLNLNTGDYEGGELRFPEFGDRTYRAPRGGAVVFSCALLHEATPVTRGARFAFLPFLYDEEAAKTRAANNAYLDTSVPQYDAVN